MKERTVILSRVICTLFGVVMAASMMMSTASADEIRVILDQAKLVKLPEKVSTIVIGNPMIADASVESGGLMIVTGKGYGVTNLVVLDLEGGVMAEHMIRVSPPQEGTVIVQRGQDRETLSCMPRCQNIVVLGDTGAGFDRTIGQISTRNSSARPAQ